MQTKNTLQELQNLQTTKSQATLEELQKIYPALQNIQNEKGEIIFNPVNQYKVYSDPFKQKFYKAFLASQYNDQALFDFLKTSILDGSLGKYIESSSLLRESANTSESNFTTDIKQYQYGKLDLINHADSFLQECKKISAMPNGKTKEDDITKVINDIKPLISPQDFAEQLMNVFLLKYLMIPTLPDYVTEADNIFNTIKDKPEIQFIIDLHQANGYITQRAIDIIDKAYKQQQEQDLKEVKERYKADKTLDDTIKTLSPIEQRRFNLQFTGLKNLEQYEEFEKDVNEAMRSKIKADAAAAMQAVVVLKQNEPTTEALKEQIKKLSNNKLVTDCQDTLNKVGKNDTAEVISELIVKSYQANEHDRSIIEKIIEAIVKIFHAEKNQDKNDDPQQYSLNRESVYSSFSEDNSEGNDHQSRESISSSSSSKQSFVKQVDDERQNYSIQRTGSSIF
jgi:hypothetical protein